VREKRQKEQKIFMAFMLVAGLDVVETL